MKRILTSLLVIITILTVIPVSSVSASAAEKTVQIQYIDVNAGGKGVYLRWNKSSNVKYYCLFRKCLDGDNISLLKKVQTNDDSKDGYLRTYDNSYKPNYTYAYQVVSLDSKRNCLQKSDWKHVFPFSTTMMICSIVSVLLEALGVICLIRLFKTVRKGPGEGK